MPDSYLKGLDEISEIDPESGPLFVDELKKLSPDFAEYFVGFAFGEIHARTVFEPKIKELISIAILIPLGAGITFTASRPRGVSCRLLRKGNN